MKVAVTGKGGAGKTTVAGTLARLLARQGLAVVAVDADPNPNLGLTLGLGEEATARLEGVVNVVLGERRRHEHDHAEGRHDHDASHPCEPPAERSAEDVLEELGVTAPDGVVLVETGRIERPAEGCLCCGSHGTTRRLFSDLDGRNRVVIADLEAGVNDLVWARPDAEDVVLVVTEPYLKSLEVARRAVAVARQMGVQRVVVVANRVAGDEDGERVRQALPGLPLVEVPDNHDVGRAGREGVAPIDLAPASTAMQAVRALATDVLRPSSGVPAGSGRA